MMLIFFFFGMFKCTDLNDMNDEGQILQQASQTTNHHELQYDIEPFNFRTLA